MARKKIGGSATLAAIQEEREKLLQQLKELEDKEKKFESEWEEKLVGYCEKTVEDVIAKNRDSEWCNDYFLNLTLGEIANAINPPPSKGKKAKGTRGKRIPLNVQKYYTLLAIQEGADKAKDIKAKYGEFINGAPWTGLAKEKHLIQEGEKAAATYSMSDTGIEFLEKLKADKEVTGFSI